MHAYLRKYARTHVRTAKEAKGDVEAEDDGSSSFPPATHARTYVRTLYVRTYVFSVRTIFAAMHVLDWPRWPG